MASFPSNWKMIRQSPLTVTDQNPFRHIRDGRHEHSVNMLHPVVGEAEDEGNHRQRYREHPARDVVFALCVLLSE